MNPINKKLILPFACMSLLLLGSCRDSDRPEEPADPDDPMKIALTLRISTIESQGADRTRAEDVPDINNGFETATSRYEGIRLLRVVITRDSVNPDDLSVCQVVEASRLFVAPEKTDDKPLLSTGEMTFNLRYRSFSREDVDYENRKVWLFANSEDILSDYPMENGTVFPEKDITQLKLSRDKGQPLIDNTGTAKKYIPMSEVFDIKIRKPVKNEDYHQTAPEMFVTRAAVKFTFNISTAGDYIDGGKLTAITVTGLADREFMMPTNTIYSPAKDSPAIIDPLSKLSGRFITAYKIPEGTEHHEFDFLSGKTISLTKGMKETYSPQMYFPESSRGTVDGQSFQEISISIDGKERAKKRFNNLASLPRNTHVVVNITINRNEVEWAATLAPYGEVWLFPTFGLNQPDDRPEGAENPGTPGTPDEP